MSQNILKCITSQCKSVITLGKGQYIYQSLTNRLRYAIHWEFWTLCNCWLIEEQFKISIFKSKTQSSLLHASEFLKMCNYLMQEYEYFSQKANISQALRKNRIFKSALCFFENLNFQSDRKSIVSLFQDQDVNYIPIANLSLMVISLLHILLNQIL